jgi:DNA-binding winged helix-turn-helix (wHTH) protein/Tol biopolymer transport system component
MDKLTTAAVIWRFGVFEFDAYSMELRRAGVPIKLRDQSSQILVYLLEHAGQIVSREELRQLLWPSDTFVDFDHSLNTAVMTLRDALGDSADKPHYIETLPKRGYRFVAPVSSGRASETQGGLADASNLPGLPDLKGALSEPVPRHRGKVGERLAWGVTALCVAILVGLGVAHWRSLPPAESLHLHLSLLPPHSTSFVPYNFAISPDGQQLAFVAAAQDGSTALWIRSLAAGTAQQLTGTEGATYPFWSPDSRQVGFFAEAKLKSVAPSSGAVQILCDAPGGFGGAWNNRNTIIFAGRLKNSGLDFLSTIVKVPASGGEPELATKGKAPSSSMFWPSALPDGDHFLYFILGNSNSAQKQGIYVGSLSTHESKLISSEIVGNIQFASSCLYYVRDGSLMAQPFDLKRLQTTGPPEAVSRQELEEAPAFSRAGFSASDDGVVVFQTATESVSELSWFDRSGKALEEIPRTGYRDPALSRDGTLLAASSDDNHNGKRYIHIYDFARGTSTLVSDGGTEVFPVLSPDGKRVAYVVNNARTSQYIEVAATDGSGKLERLAASDFLIPNDWSADGRFLVYMDFPNGEPKLDVLDLLNHSQTAFGPGAEAQFSPDGKWIVLFQYAVSRDGKRSAKAASTPPSWASSSTPSSMYSSSSAASAYSSSTTPTTANSTPRKAPPPMPASSPIAPASPPGTSAGRFRACYL